jgi:hypothetical protein
MAAPQLVDKVDKLPERATEVKSKARNRPAIEAYKSTLIERAY